MAWWNRTAVAESVYTPDPEDEARREALLRYERERAEAARAAVQDSAGAAQTEAKRLRDSREIAAALREQINNNGFTERMAASFRLREKGTT